MYERGGGGKKKARQGGETFFFFIFMDYYLHCVLTKMTGNIKMAKELFASENKNIGYVGGGKSYVKRKSEPKFLEI